MTYPGELEMNQFAEEVIHTGYLYVSASEINFFRSKTDSSSTDDEKDVTMSPCDADERVCDQLLEGAVDMSFLMYMAVIEEYGLTIPFCAFKIDVLKFLNVAPSQILPNSWAFIRGLEILCKFGAFCRCLLPFLWNKRCEQGDMGFN